MSENRNGWTVTTIQRLYPCAEASIWTLLDEDGEVSDWTAHLSTGPGSGPTRERFATLAEAAAWCDEQAAQHDIERPGVS